MLKGDFIAHAQFNSTVFIFGLSCSFLIKIKWTMIKASFPFDAFKNFKFHDILVGIHYASNNKNTH